MNETLAASSPDQNAVVMASAGTGKTWLLVTRLLRLLMEDVPPDTILAITFTRKAAAEMQARLLDRLFQLMTLDEDLLSVTLANLGISATNESIHRARNLYESLLLNEQQIRITTFHAFCNEILKRFPIEANVPPGFDLLENNGLLEQEAYDALFNEATSDPDDELAQALDILLTQYGSTFALRDALDEFMQHRADWWAYTRSEKHPVNYACDRLAAQLQIDPLQNPYGDFINSDVISVLQEFMSLLNKHLTKTNQKTIAIISAALNANHSIDQRIEYIKSAFLTKEGDPLSRRQTKTQEKAMGPVGESRFLEIHESICTKLGILQEHERRIMTYNRSKAWYIAGEKLLKHYQRIKLEQRQLDFTDLESRVYELLNHSNNALWIQYKLDQRIDHFLVDEFQDTNPTQWRMILPLLNELAASRHIHKRSVFLVGDGKQSIYRFRRANPRLISAAYGWLEKNLDTKQYTLDVSWRSSPAIIKFINTIFTRGTLGNRLTSFQVHDTHLHHLWGKVEVLPLVRTEKPELADSSNGLRNPLHTPRVIVEDLRHHEEGKLIASRIKELFENKTLLDHKNAPRALTYSDIIVLVRNRTHMPAYEKALREAHIPYQSTGKTTLLDSLEVQDIVALLDTLITPYNNLALAGVLRSPLFDCSDEDLMLIASRTPDITTGNRNTSWMERITAMTSILEEGTPLKRAVHWLTKWRSLVGQLPVHDLLDRIFSEGNIFQRYESAYPAHLKQRVSANLSRFIELALEIDSGRYPSLPHFLSRLRSLGQYARDALDEPSSSTENSVQIMTIHAAKGLEAAVIFLADSTRNSTRTRTYTPMITWPENSDIPDNYFVVGKKSEMDNRSKELFNESEQEELHEEANLLYVALSRAKQLIYITGCAPVRGNALGWYGLMAENLADDVQTVINNGYILESGNPLQQAVAKTCPETSQITVPDPELTRPLPQSLRTHIVDITPSKITDNMSHVSNASEIDGRLRGNVIHRLLSLLTSNEELPEQALLQHVANEFSLELEYPAYNEWWHEAHRLIHQPELRKFFDPACYTSAYNELPIQYYVNEQLVHGVIDRLILNDNNIMVIDYKTHRYAEPGNLATLAGAYYEQLGMYGNGVQKIWPQKPVRLILLFTACATAYELHEDSIPQTVN